MDKKFIDEIENIVEYINEKAEHRGWENAEYMAVDKFGDDKTLMAIQWLGITSEDKSNIDSLHESNFSNLKLSNMETTKNVIANLFNELNLKHGKGGGEILLSYQDDSLFVCEQDYGDLKILEEITFKDPV